MKEILQTFAAPTNREKILLAGFAEMHQNGYQGMRIEAILKATGLAKGALYHHFPTKIALAYAIIDEILYEHSKQHFETILNAHPDPIEGNCKLIADFCCNATEDEVNLGCPLNNLAQEMSGLDEGIQTRLNKIYDAWVGLVAASLKKGQKTGHVSASVNAVQTATFILCSYQGIIGVAKCMQSPAILKSQSKILCNYIKSLRA